MKNILIAGYPRSGNTFLGYLLSYHFNAPYYDMYDLAKALAGEGNLEGLTLAPEAFSGTFARADQEKQVGAVLKSHELPENLHPKHRAALDHVPYQKSDPLILITREPKDVAVSYFTIPSFDTLSGNDTGPGTCHMQCAIGIISPSTLSALHSRLPATGINS